MDSKNLIRSYHELSDEFVELLNSLSGLRALSELCLEGVSESQLLAKALEILVQNQDLERCSVYLLEGGRLVNRGGLDWCELVGQSGPQRGTCSFALGEGLVGRAASSGEIQHCRDACTDERFVHQLAAGDGTSAPGPQRGSILSVPIKSPARDVLGVLNVSYPEDDFFTKTHERALLIFANLLGQLLLSNRLLTQLDKVVHERTRQLESALEEAESLKRRYETLSIVDELTGLHNRRFFFPETEAVIVRALRYRAPFSLLLLDLDHFKRVNDTYGHTTGDSILRRFAELLREECRDADILARFGGEEFAIALPETELSGAVALAERIRERTRLAVWHSDGCDIPLTTSIGITGIDADSEQGRNAGDVLERLIKEADQALYFGKHKGRDQSRTYQEIACRLDQDGATNPPSP